jgi:hypothetical protein
MTYRPLPIAEKIVKAVDEVGLTTNGAAHSDVYINELKQICSRPGLVQVCDLGTAAAVDGVFWWDSQTRLIAVSGGKTYQLTTATGTPTEITGSTHSTGTRVTFAEMGSTTLFSANGAKIKKITTSAVADLSDADAPTTVTHVAALDRYLIANQTGTGLFWWSDVNAPEVWTGNYAEAEAGPDLLKAILVSNMEINLLGSATMEIFHDDGTSPFSRLGQGFAQSGTIAPYSFAYSPSQDMLMWLDATGQVVAMNGRTPVPVSLTINKYIATFTTITDALGDCITIDKRPYYVLKFPTQGVTLVWDFSTAAWYEWANYTGTGYTYTAFLGNCYAYSPAWAMTLVGGTDGKIYKFDSTAYADAGVAMRSFVRTGHYNHGSEAKLKHSNALVLRLKRAVATLPALQVRYRDEGGSTYSTARSIIQTAATPEFRAKETRLGSYYSRQWEIAHPQVLVSVEEDVDLEA